MQERTSFLVFFYTLPPIRYPLFQFLHALLGRGTLRVPDIGREASRPYKKTIVLTTFYETIKN